jgi:uncharacterized protein (DUF983 family)
MLSRALRRRCPRCGERSIWKSWFNTKDRCPRCAHVFEREEGYWVMAVVVNTALVEVIFGIFFVGAVVASWPEIDWSRLLIVALVTNGILPFLFFPFSKTLWIALDLRTHPRT